MWSIEEKARQLGETNLEYVGEIHAWNYEGLVHAWNYEGLHEEIISERMNLRSFEEKELTGPNANHVFQFQTLT